MPTQLDLLTALQDVDQQLHEKERLLQDLQRQLAAIAVEIEQREHGAHVIQQRLNELESRRRDMEGGLKQEEEKIKEKRVRLSRIRNERELLSLQHEIELRKNENTKLEDELLVVLEQIDAEAQDLSQTENDIAELQTRLASQSESVRDQIAGLEQETQAVRAARDRVARDVDARTRARYERIFATRGGSAVVEVRDGTCQGCHMHLPPHMCNQIQSAQLEQNSTIFLCPHPQCGRILYWRFSADAGEQ